MEDVVKGAMDILKIRLTIEGIEIPIFWLIAGMLIVYYVLKIVFQRKEG